MAAVDASIVGQSAQLQQRLPHHFRRALDDAPAADREQRVADKGKFVGREDVADVTGGVSRRLEHPSPQRADPNLVIFAHRRIDEWNARGLAVRGDDTATVALLEVGDAAGVVRMVMGDEDIREAPAGCLQRGLHGCGLGRIDRRRRATFGIVQEHAVIVLKAKK